MKLRETYVDLERQHLNEKTDSLKIEVIEQLTDYYPNDIDLGRAVREFINSNKGK